MSENKGVKKELEVNTVAGNIEDVLNLMSRVNEVFTYGVWIPSLNREVMFREINTSQQKRLIKSLIDSPVYNTELIFTLRQILKENCADPKIDIDNLTILDKLFIVIKMRMISIGDVIEVDFGNNNVRGFSLEGILDKAKKDIIAPSPKEFNIEPYTVYCSIPSILTEYRLEDEMRRNVDEVKVESNSEIRAMIGDAFIGEIVKFIDRLDIKDGDKITRINLNDISFRNRIALIEALPIKLIEQVISYITEIRKELDKVVLISTTVVKDGKEEKLEERLNINGSFFTSSSE